MSKHWVFTARVAPPENQVISVRFGSSVMFAAYSPLLRQWFHVFAGGEEAIAEPPLWFCEEEWAAEHQRTDFVPRDSERSRSSVGKKKETQMLLF